jgi:hypothetical protein
MRSGNRLDPSIYVRAFPLLFRHLSIVTAPLLAAVVSILLDQLSQLTTDPIGGAGAGIYGFIERVVYLIAFGVATIQARDAWHGYKGTFDDAWSEAKGRIGGIALAAVGFVFILNFAAQIGAFVNLSILLLLVVAFLLIYTMPAAAISGAQAGYAIQASYRAAIAHPWAAALLAIAYVVCTTFVPLLLAPLYGGLPSIVVQLIGAAINALLLAYLAFPFAKQYEDVA